MYYVIGEYYVEAECELLEIVEVKEEPVNVKYSSENYENCSKFVDSYNEYIKEQMEQRELDAG